MAGGRLLQQSTCVFVYHFILEHYAAAPLFDLFLLPQHKAELKLGVLYKAQQCGLCFTESAYGHLALLLSVCPLSHL